MKNAIPLILGALVLMSFRKKKAAAAPGTSIPDASTRAGSTAKGAAAPSPGAMDAPPPTGAGGDVVIVVDQNGNEIAQVVPV